MMTLEDQFISRVSAFLGRSDLSPTAFGQKAVGDPNLMRQIARGRSPSLRTADRILAFISKHDVERRRARNFPIDIKRRRNPTSKQSTRRGAGR